MSRVAVSQCGCSEREGFGSSHVHTDDSSRVRRMRSDSRSVGKRSDLSFRIARSVLCRLLLLEHGVRRRGRQSQGDIGEIASGVILRHVGSPVDHTRFDGLPLVLSDSPINIHQYSKESLRGGTTHLSRMSRLVYL